MNKQELTQRVMARILRFEERRTRQWLVVFAVIMCFIIVSIGLSLFTAYTELAERRTLDMFEIFYEDREIVLEFWQDTLFVALEELPKSAILTGVGLVMLLLGIWVFTRQRRRIVSRRLAELAKQKKTGNN